MSDYQSYVICTSPRSGSTLLCELLAATERSGKPDSHFHQPSLPAWLASYDLEGDRFADEGAALEAVFRAARERGTGTTGIFGLRLQRHSFDFFLQQLGVSYPGFSSDVDRFEAAFGSTLFVYLKRENKLEQAISLVKASQTGLWHKAPDGTELERLSSPREPVYDADEIARNVAELTAYDEAWVAWFSDQKINPLRVTYDALSANPQNVLACLLGQLGLDPSLATGIATPVAKLADATNRDWAERYMRACGGDPV